MKANEVIDLLTARLPVEGEWSGMRGEPYGPYNVPKNLEVRKVLYCVTPGPDVLHLFKSGGYDMVISHHPYVMGSSVPQLIFHTALDCGIGGLNDQWRDALNVKNAKHFDGTLGWYGEIDPTDFDALCTKIEAWIGHSIAGQKFTRIQTVESVVICSGLGGMVCNLALETGADCYVLGEATQSAERSGFRAMIEVGHTLSERMGLSVFQEALIPHGIQVDGTPLKMDRFGSEVYRTPHPVTRHTGTVVPLSDELMWKMSQMPESGMGFRLVNAHLRDGTVVRNLLVFNDSDLEIPTRLKIDPESIVDIELSDLS